jgi:hypothetical protein
MIRFKIARKARIQLPLLTICSRCWATRRQRSAPRMAKRYPIRRRRERMTMNSFLPSKPHPLPQTQGRTSSTRTKSTQQGSSFLRNGRVFPNSTISNTPTSTCKLRSRACSRKRRSSVKRECICKASTRFQTSPNSWPSVPSSIPTQTLSSLPPNTCWAHCCTRTTRTRR